MADQNQKPSNGGMLVYNARDAYLASWWNEWPKDYRDKHEKPQAVRFVKFERPQP